MKKPGRNDPCPCGSGRKYKNCCLSEHQPIVAPPIGTLTKRLDMGTSDPFIARMFNQVLQIRDFLYQEPKERLEFDKHYDPVLRNLLEARMVKERLTNLIESHTEQVTSGKIAKFNGKVIEVTETVDDDLNIWFKDFFIRGIIATRGLTKLGTYLGFKISFLFYGEEKFEKGAGQFLAKHTGEGCAFFVDMIRDDREKWYRVFDDLRIKIEHHGFRLSDTRYAIRGNTVMPIFPELNSMSVVSALSLFWENLFHLCEDIVVFLMSFKLPEGCMIVQIPEDKRDKSMPIRYRVVPRNLPPGAKKIHFQDIKANPQRSRIFTSQDQETRDSLS